MKFFFGEKLIKFNSTWKKESKYLPARLQHRVRTTLRLGTQTKVNKFQLVLLVYQNILGFQVYSLNRFRRFSTLNTYLGALDIL